MTADLPLIEATSTCGCGEAHESDPVLDARAIPHAVRHAAIFGSLDSLGDSAAMILIAPHDPLPLLAQARDRYGDAMSVEYLRRGPDAWHLRFQRIG